MKKLINVELTLVVQKITTSNSIVDGLDIKDKKNASKEDYKIYSKLNFYENTDINNNNNNESVVFKDYSKVEDKGKEYNTLQNLLYYIFDELLKEYSKENKYNVLPIIYSLVDIESSVKFNDAEKKAIESFLVELKISLQSYLTSEDFIRCNDEYEDKINAIKI